MASRQVESQYIGPAAAAEDDGNGEDDEGSREEAAAPPRMAAEVVTHTFLWFLSPSFCHESPISL